jgi:hypothetical protein
MKATAAVLIVLLSAGFALAAADQPVTREQALAALADKHSVESRRLGAAHLGETDQMQDVPHWCRSPGTPIVQNTPPSLYLF